MITFVATISHWGTAFSFFLLPQLNWEITKQQNAAANPLGEKLYAYKIKYTAFFMNSVWAIWKFYAISTFNMSLT